MAAGHSSDNVYPTCQDKRETATALSIRWHAHTVCPLRYLSLVRSAFLAKFVIRVKKDYMVTSNAGCDHRATELKACSSVIKSETLRQLRGSSGSAVSQDRTSD